MKNEETQNMKRTLLYPSFILMCISIFFLSCDSREQKKPKLKQEQWEKKVKEIRSEVTSRYNPVVFPPKSFSTTTVITYNLKKLLVNEDARPVVFEGLFQDITNDEGQFFVHLVSRLSEEALDERRVKFHLRCEYDQIKSILENPPEYDPFSDSLMGLLFMIGYEKGFLVVCRVSDVKRIEHYTVTGQSSEGSEDVELEIETPDVFSITGDLIEIVRYPKDPTKPDFSSMFGDKG